MDGHKTVRITEEEVITFIIWVKKSVNGVSELLIGYLEKVVQYEILLQNVVVFAVRKKNLEHCPRYVPGEDVVNNQLKNGILVKSRVYKRQGKKLV